MSEDHDNSAEDWCQGVVKWFNNKAGYGFVTATSGDKEGTDIFVHHSSITVGKEQYKYLVQGEYVEFLVVPTDEGAQHDFQAGDIRGINSGKLMCETRFENRRPRRPRREGNEEGGGAEESNEGQGARRSGGNEGQGARRSGGGPREGMRGNQRRNNRNNNQSREQHVEGS